MSDRDMDALREAIREGVREGLEPLREFLESYENMMKQVTAAVAALERKNRSPFRSRDGLGV